MIEDTMPLDGNAAAGRLGEIFTPDMTRATIACAGCAREGPLATLRLYGGGVGTVLRCPSCDAVNLRVLDTGTTINLDLSGSVRISFEVGRR